MKKILLLLATLSSLIIARNDIPSCYDALKMDGPKGAAQDELFVLVDQTTVLDKNMMKFIKNGNAVTIASFSANSNGKYTDIPYSGKLEELFPDSKKHSTSKKVLRKYEGCMNGQYKYAKRKATKALVHVLKGANKKLPHSDIVKSLADIAKNIIATSKSKHKTVLLVSDMMEHSSITSFYSKGGLKKVSTDKEMSKIEKSGYMANFSGADVYVIGTGMAGKESYRDSKTLKALTSFWESYFSKSNAHLKAIGTPMLLEDVK